MAAVVGAIRFAIAPYALRSSERDRLQDAQDRSFSGNFNDIDLSLHLAPPLPPHASASASLARPDERERRERLQVGADPIRAARAPSP
jgi:hypothetical protein